MKVTRTAIPDVMLIEPRVFGDARGFFYESFNERAFAEATGVQTTFVQDNHSKSVQGVLRGLHYQIEQPQGKLVRVPSAAFSTWRSICAARRQRLANGSVPCCPPRTKPSSGCHPVLAMVLW